ncbi:DUF3450 domain-containing protein [Paenimyroides aestuarii]|uniref:Lipoprotein n=1 Tax=Paenimyroides aestuarii TaxID=2968490 RepID=A0ABY5NVJ9_9FLAO|nr:hypothetical protein [Paenimyroides aestuarii]UUV22621.1 hypothetical protein NPX36_06140 [Paenimyroides aestuarii]
MNTKIYLIPFVFLLISCVPKDKYKQLEEENNSLQFEIDNQNMTLAVQSQDIENYKKQIERLEEQKSEIEKELIKYKPKGKTLSSKTFSEQEAINTVNDYYNFYERDYVIRNVKVRRQTNASFWVSYEKVNRKFAENDFHYNAETKVLEFYDDNKYQLKNNW